MEEKRFHELIGKFSQAKVAVLGDFFLDLYIHMERSLSELSLETHKEAFQAIDLRGQPGAAGVVTNNLRSLGATTAAVACIGKDGNGFTLRKALESGQVNIEYMITTEERFTPTYTKPLMREVDGRIIELNRIDIINRSPNSEELNRALSDNLYRVISAYNGILVTEQVKHDGYGTMSPLLRQTLAQISENRPEKTIVADSRHFASEYRGISLKMNLSEAISASRHLGSKVEVKTQAKKLPAAQLCAQTFWNAFHKPVFITLGEDGICGMSEDGFFHLPGYQLEGPIDIVGAGDSVLAGLGLALCVGANPEEAAFIGNLVGSITVQQIGTTGIATLPDLERRYHEYQKQLKDRK
jgi:rfaE bifunctional protein kinase chain/domain